MLFKSINMRLIKQWAVVLLGGLSVMSSVLAAVTNLTDTPLSSSTKAGVKPNIMLLMDTSSSMGFTHMPDDVENDTQADQSIGYKSYQCNSIYYNPNTKYELPKNADGSSLPTPSFNAALKDYYIDKVSAVNLASSFSAYSTSTRRIPYEDTPQAAYYYVYTGSAVMRYNALPCTQVDLAAPGNSGDTPANGGIWKRILVSTTSGRGTTVNELQNFAIWYTYYRTRLAMSKSALSSAFAPLTDKYRVGFVTANPGTPVSSARYQAIADFNATNKSDWYSKVFSQTASGTSPMREGLARVGRHFAGKSDGINTNMTPDPMQYACQRNYAFMTTDGYWNTGAETAGPVGLDGTTLVGQQDGSLTSAAGNTPRPIFDGGTNQRRDVTNQTNLYSWAPCVGPDSIRTSTQITQAASGQVQFTVQPRVATLQNLQRTSTTSEITTQTLRTTAVTNQSTARTDLTTLRQSESTTQNLASTSQYFQFTTTLTKVETRIDRATFQNLISQTQYRVSTSQLTSRQEHLTAATVQSTGGTSQNIVSTAQRLRSTSQTTNANYVSTAQRLRATSRTDQTVTQLRRSTSQQTSYNGEVATPVQTCTPVSGLISCPIVTTGPTPVASCTPQTASSSNAWTSVTCVNANISGPTAVASCTAAVASSGNGYQTTVCTPVNTPATPVASCTSALPNSGNAFTTTTCTDNNTGPTLVGSCTPIAASAGNNYVATTCSVVPSTVSTGPTPVQTCTPASPNSGNSFTTTTCSDNNTGPTAVQTCTGTNTPAAATSGNSWTTTTCAPVTTSGFVQNCTGANAPAVASIGNAWTTRTCTTNSVPATAVATCTPQTGATGNNWLTRTCATVIDSPTAGVAACTNITGSGPNYVNTVCNTVTTGPTPQAAVCAPIAAAAGNSWTATTCANVITTNVPIATCTPSAAGTGNGFTTTTCSTNNTGPTAVAPTACTAQAPNSGNSFVTVTCTPTVLSSVAVASCTPIAASAGNGWVTTTCTNPATPNVFVASCVVGSTTAGAVTTTCGRNVTGPTPVATCTVQTGNSTNNFLDRTCTTNNTGPTFVASCTPQTAAAGNAFVNRTCNTQILSGPIGAASCSPVAASSANLFVATICTPVNTGPTAVLPASCSAAAAAAANNWTSTTCPVATATVPVQTCTASGPSSGNGFTNTTCNTNVTGPTPVASCTSQTGNTGNSWLTRSCTTVNSANAPVAACTPVAASAGNGFASTQCSTATTGPTPVASCTPIAASLANNFVATSCPNLVTGPTAVASCTPGTNASFVSTTCAASPSSTTTFVASCTPASPTSGNGFLTTVCSSNVTTTTVATTACTSQTASAANAFTSVTCAAAPAEKVQVRTVTSSYTEDISNGIVASTSAVVSSTSATTDVTPAVCYTTATKPALPTTPPALPGGCTAWPCSVTTALASGGSSNSLADVAQYYYLNDLRPDFANTDLDGRSTTTLVIGPGGPESDRVQWQHMTTFGMGLGVAGTLPFRDDYLSATTGTFANLRAGTQNWPIWPDATPNYYNDPRAYNDAKSIDDFWHASVNGRGQFFSADVPQKVVDGVRSVIRGIDAADAAGTGLSVSNNTPVAGDNFAYSSSYKSLAWTGDLIKNEILNGVVTTTAVWSAQSRLDAQTSAACDNRKIYYRSAGTSTMAEFTWDTKLCDASGVPTGTARTGLGATEQAYFDSTEVASFTHYAAMTDGSSSTANQRGLAAGANLVNFLRGQRGFEGFVANSATKLYRAREHVLGDIVGSSVAIVKSPNADYSDAGYATFLSTNAARSTTLYVGSNSGMLHAISADTGSEKWAYIPRAVMPDLYRLADNNYDVNHRFFVDGSPSVGDVYDVNGTAWKTILVGGFNKGGKGYYALDVTNPDNPKPLWDFNQSSSCGTTGSTSDCDVGLSYGRPLITKLINGTWVVLFTSGYNNVTNGGTGKGILYVVNAITGALISKLDTGVGDVTTPSGLRDINNYVANGRLDNTTLRVYGGDLLGNVWRFDINDTIAPTGSEATLLATAKDPTGVAQPITTRVQLAEVDGRTFVVAATGQLLSAADSITTQRQTVYGFKDTLGGTSPLFTDMRSSLRPITLTRTGNTGNTSCAAATATCTISDGWYLDLPETAERVNVDPLILAGTLLFASNVPTAAASTSCDAGRSYFNAIDLVEGTGRLVGGGASVLAFNELSVGLNFLLPGDAPGGFVPSGTARGISTGDSRGTSSTDFTFGSSNPLGRRVSWREIIKP
jgi:Tfp pilus tip-associated adhesin PilY1